MSTDPAQSVSRREGLRDKMDVFWDRLVDMDGNRQRAYPRVQACAPITICTDGEELSAQLHDIGRGGLQVRCDRAASACIAPTTARERVSVTVTVRTVLADGDEEHSLEARCCLVHVTLLEAEDEEAEADVALGFCFESLDLPARRTLEWFILRALEPA